MIDTHIHYRNWLHDLLLVNGTTSILDLGNPLIWTAAVSDGIAKGKIRGPRMFFTGEHFDLEGPQLDHYWVEHGFLDSWVSGGFPDTGPANLIPDRAINRHKYFATSPERGRELVKKFVAKGASAIKVHHSLKPEVLSAISDEAHRHGISVVGHRQSAWEVIELGMDFIEHTSPVAIATISDPEKLQMVKDGLVLDPHHLMDPAVFPTLIEKLVESNIYFNPTLSGTWRGINPRSNEYKEEMEEYFSQPGLEYVPRGYLQKYHNHFSRFDRFTAEQIEILKQGYNNVEIFIKEFVDAGGKLLAGSDPVNTGIPGLGIHQEMELMVDAGVSPREALKSATIYAAELLHKETELGTVEATKFADLVVLAGNPLDDIENTQKIEMVILDGKVVDLSFHPDYEIPIPRTEREIVDSGSSARIFDMVPEETIEGQDKDVELTLTGRFLPSSKVMFNESEIRTTFENVGTLRATIPSSLLRNVGTYAIQVINPIYGGTTANSNTVYFVVRYR